MDDGLPPLRAVIADLGLSARKSFGQNFILDLNLTSKIARQADDLTNCDVLEIGPGPGGLTRGLLASGARKVVAVEKDRRCIPALEQIKEHYPDQLHIIEGDALTQDLSKVLAPPYKIVANLPYNIGTELLIRWLTPQTWPPYWDSLTLMFQREVAERIVAKSGSKAFGRLAVLSQWRCDASIAMRVPASVFTPPPKVESALIHIKPTAPKFDADLAKLERVTALAFGQRRKMLRASLKSLTPNISDELTALGIDPTARAENLTIEDFCKLTVLI
jgi:16S rRNA (adenine1518-N6/adenine1519-N6)-dimethyltransferase